MSLKKELAAKFKDKKYYTVELFNELGFVWKECSVCGNGFWTLDSELTICGETTCIGRYQFIGKKLAGDPYGDGSRGKPGSSAQAPRQA